MIQEILALLYLLFSILLLPYGLFIECTGAYTNFKTDEYYFNMENWYHHVVDEADALGLSYKLVDIIWCAETPPDP